jgi:hypothetical protein
MSTCVDHFPPPALLKVIVTVFGRASGGTGSRETSTPQLPSSGDAPADWADAASLWANAAATKIRKSAFIWTRLQRFAPAS